MTSNICQLIGCAKITHHYQTIQVGTKLYLSVHCSNNNKVNNENKIMKTIYEVQGLKRVGMMIEWRRGVLGRRKGEGEGR